MVYQDVPADRIDIERRDLLNVACHEAGHAVSGLLPARL